jgi:dipeptidyl aminopeptidase/acylaminoacyl peptidase
MAKKIFAISTLLFILLIGAIFVYNYAFKKPSVQTQAPVKTVDEGKTGAQTSDSKNKEASTQSDSDINPVLDQSAFGATLAPDNNSLYYFSGDNGQLNQMDFTGKLEKVVSTEEFLGVQKVIWNKPRNKAIVKRSNGPEKSKFLLLDLAGKKVFPLKDNIDSVAWSSLGDKIIYKFYDPKTKKRTLNVSDPDGSNWRKLAEADYVSLEISVIPESSNISFWPSADAFVSSSVNLVNFSGENKREILKERFGADILWSPDGKLAAVTYTDQKGGKKTDLAIMNSDGGQFHSLSFPTFAKKCAWSEDSKYLYCAMPGNIPESSVLPNDWQENKIQTADTFWKIGIDSGKKDRLVEADKIGGSYDVLNPFLSSDEKTLFFVNKADGKLYKLNII